MVKTKLKLADIIKSQALFKWAQNYIESTISSEAPNSGALNIAARYELYPGQDPDWAVVATKIDAARPISYAFEKELEELCQSLI